MKLFFPRSKTALTLLFSCAVSFLPAQVFADTGFYNLNERWEKSVVSGKTKQEALNDGFTSALSSQSFSQSSPGISTPVAPAIKKTLSEVTLSSLVTEIEQGQSLFVRANSTIVKFIPTEEGIVLTETIGTDTIRIEGIQIGNTFIHVWDSQGRKTFSVRVIPPKYEISRYQLSQTEIAEKTRSFKLGYDHNRSAFYTGPKFQDKTRTSLDFNQIGSFSGDSPYGEMAGHAQTQKSGGKMLLTDAQVSLKDGKIGPFRNFNVAAGDSSVRPELLVFPTARIRGGAAEIWDDDKRTQWMGFYGREQSSIIGTLTPGVISKRTLNSYLSGGVLDYKVNEDSRIRAGIFDGFGQSRDDTLNRQGTGVQTFTNFGSHTRLETETDFDSEHFAHKHAVINSFEKVRIKNEFRDISKKFFTLIGPPSRQGEVGYLLDVTASPTNYLGLTGTLDIFRDRLIFNPDDPQALNIHTDLGMSIVPSDTSSILLTFQDLDDSGRIGPTHQTTIGGQFNQRFSIFGHPATFFSRYQNRNSRILTNDLNNYEQDQVVLGFYVPIFWGINFSVQNEWSRLDEPNLDRVSYPRAITYTWDYSRQILDTPFYLDARLRIRDEENTESSNSFMSGEDLTEVSGGITYREYEDLELFLNGSYTTYNPESLNLSGHRMEAQFITGMRYVFDTKIRWSVVGSFKGYVFKDANGNGIKEPGDVGMKGMSITSSDGHEAVTDENGFFEFKSIPGKQVTFVLDSGKIPYGYAPTSSVQQQREILQGQTQEVNYGLTPRSEVTGIVFNDLNGNGKYETTDAGIGKVKIMLETGEVVRTNNLGVYSFPNVVAGEHTANLVLASLPEGYLPQQAPKKKFVVFEGIRYELPFPVQAARAVTGRVYLDTNKNGFFDASEKVISGVKVLLGDRSVLTDDGGWYLFDGLNQGSFPLSIDPVTLPSGYVFRNTKKIEIPATPLTLSDENLALEESV